MSVFYLIHSTLLFPRATSQVACLHVHLATAARVKYPVALQRCKFDAPLLAAGVLTIVCNRSDRACPSNALIARRHGADISALSRCGFYGKAPYNSGYLKYYNCMDCSVYLIC